ncbi:MAG: NAD-dependent epimerase/dehydratase family protein [Deltaproteobacteria bacterium]|nr:NAD-dependent epimerase/dehydratase family protein [Deltaproteobacteria bacterium]
MSERTAIVAGGTGLVGGCLTDLLLARPQWSRVMGVTRRRTGRSHSRYQEIPVDFAVLDESRPLPKAEVAFCCLGTTLKKAGSREAFRAVDFDAVVRFAKAAKAGGTERLVVVTARGAHPGSLIFYNRIKGETETALRVLGFSSLAIARPSLLLGDRQEHRRGEHVAVVASRWLRPLLAPLDSRPIEATTVAKALVAIAEAAPEGARVYENPELHSLGA